MNHLRRLANASLFFTIAACGPSVSDGPPERLVSGLYQLSQETDENTCATPPREGELLVSVTVTEDALSTPFLFATPVLGIQSAELQRDLDQPDRYASSWTRIQDACGATKAFSMEAMLDHEALVISASTRTEWTGLDDCDASLDTIPPAPCSFTSSLEYTLVEACVEPCRVEEGESELYCAC